MARTRNMKPLTRGEETRIRKDRDENGTPLKELSRKYRRGLATINEVLGRGTATVVGDRVTLTENQRKVAEANKALTQPPTLKSIVTEFIEKMRAADPGIESVDIRVHKTDEFTLKVKS